MRHPGRTNPPADLSIPKALYRPGRSNSNPAPTPSTTFLLNHLLQLVIQSDQSLLTNSLAPIDMYLLSKPVAPPLFCQPLGLTITRASGKTSSNSFLVLLTPKVLTLTLTDTIHTHRRISHHLCILITFNKALSSRAQSLRRKPSRPN